MLAILFYLLAGVLALVDLLKPGILPAAVAATAFGLAAQHEGY